MASEVNRQNISAEDFFFFSHRFPRNLLTSAFGLRRSFHAGLQPQGCTKPLIRVQAGRPFARACRLRVPRPAPSKIMRSPRRPFKALRSRPQGAVFVHGQLDARAASGQGPRVPIVGTKKAEPCRGPFQAARSGAVAHGCVRDQRPQRVVPRSTLLCARPWRASVRRGSSPARSAKLPYGAGIAYDSLKIVVIVILRSPRGASPPPAR